MLCRIVSVDEMQFGFRPERGKIYDVFKKGIMLKDKSCICVLWT